MGRVVHFEIHAADPDRARLFYEHVFGWNLDPWGEHGYWLVRTGDGTPGIDGGLVPRRGDEPQPGQALNAFLCTVAVDDVEDIVERAMDAGGALILPRHAIPGVGWLAYLQDSEGNTLGVMQEDRAAT